MAIMNPTIGQVVKYEEELRFSRDDVTVAAGQNLQLGTVVGRVTSSGEIGAWNPAATNGLQNVAGVILDNVDATAGSVTSVMLARHAIVARDSLIFAGTPTQEEIDSAIDTLKSLGILARATV